MTRLLRVASVGLGLMIGNAFTSDPAAGQRPQLLGQLGSRGRPIVVLLHGRAQGGRERADVVTEWESAFYQGLHDAGYAGLIDEADLYFIWYGDLYRPDDDSYRADPECSGGEDSPDARNVFADVSDRGIERRGLSGSERVRRRGISALVGGAKSSTFIRAALEDTYLFFSDPVRRCTTSRRLRVFLDDARLADRPVILVSHSMGGLVAYDVLRNRYGADQYPINRWITMGSQLGIPYVMQQFDGISTSQLAPVPPSVRSWINIKNRHDNLAFSMRPYFCVVLEGECTLAGGSTVRPVEMRITATYGRREPKRLGAHWIGNYLRHRATATAIATAWCAAFTIQAKPAECSNVRSTDVFQIPDEW